MTVICMREELSKVYPYPKWQQKVARMHESQVVAVYKNLAKRNELFTHKPKENEPRVHQITIWEMMKENERNDTCTKC